MRTESGGEAMWRWLRWWWSWRLFASCVLAFFVWQAIVFLRPRPRRPTPDELEAWRATATEAARRLAQHVPPGSRIGVAHLANDPRDEITAILKASLAATPGWHVEERSVFQRFLSDVSRALAAATSLDEVLHAGRRVDLDVVIAGRALTPETTNGTLRTAMHLLAYDTHRGMFVFRDTIRMEWRPSWIVRARRSVAAVPLRWRVAIWLISSLVLPWVTSFATSWAIRWRANWVGFVLILAYTVIDLVLALALLGDSPFNWGGPWRWLGLTVMCALYNFWSCERIASRE